MNETQLKAIFREQELARREARQKVILNHAALLDEQKPPAEIEQNAISRLRQANELETRERINEIWSRLTWWSKVKAVFQKVPF